MPNSASAKKRLRQSLVRRARNRAAKSTLRTQLKKTHAAVDAGEHDKADVEFRKAAKMLDQLASRKVIHRNVASRTKSRLQHLLKKSKQPASA